MLRRTPTGDNVAMTKTIEFETELTGQNTLSMPSTVAEALPSRGKATVVVILDMDPDETTWRQASYEQFLSDDSAEDAVYDKYL
jgi:hypothetical protein